MFKLGVITDEVSQDFEQALQFAKRHNLDCVELRSAWEKGPFDYDDADIARICALSAQYGIPVLAISSPLFKCGYFDEDTKAEQIKCFHKLVEYASVLGAGFIRIFDFLKDSRVTHKEIAEAYRVPMELCRAKGITLLVESEPTTNSVDSQSVGALVRFINDPVVRALYEPGNNIYTDTDEIPYPDGFRYVKDCFAHIHVKDAVRENGKGVGVAVGSGVVDYPGLIRELLQMNYQGALMLETHYKPNCIIPDEVLHNPKGSQISYLGDIASEECMITLKAMIEQAKAACRV